MCKMRKIAKCGRGFKAACAFASKEPVPERAPMAMPSLRWAFLAFLILQPGLVYAQRSSLSDESLCTTGPSTAFESRIEHCSSIIDSGRFSGEYLASIFASRGIANRLKGDYQKSVSDHTNAIRLAPLSNYYFNRGVTYRAMGQNEKAIVDYTDSIRMNPRNPAAYLNRANALYAENETKSAIKDYTISYLLSGDRRALLGRGLALIREDKLKGARLDFEQIIKRDPSHVLARQQVKLIDDLIAAKSAPQKCGNEPYCELKSALKPLIGKQSAPSIILLGRAGALTRGDLFTFDVELGNQSAHIHVAYFQADGSVVHLVQNDKLNQKTLDPRSKIRFGDGKDGMPAFRVSPPFGDELVMVIASRYPLFAVARPQIENQRKFIEALMPLLKRQSGSNSLFAAYSSVTTKDR